MTTSQSPRMLNGSLKSKCKTISWIKMLDQKLKLTKKKKSNSRIMLTIKNRVLSNIKFFQALKPNTNKRVLKITHLDSKFFPWLSRYLRLLSQISGSLINNITQWTLAKSIIVKAEKMDTKKAKRHLECKSLSKRLTKSNIIKIFHLKRTYNLHTELLLCKRTIVLRL